MAADERDLWAEWLAERRFGGNDAVRRRYLERLTRVRDEVLDRAGVSKADVVLDVGCGEGLLGFGALARGAREVVFSDISTDLLDLCRASAQSLGVQDRCRFVRASADELDLADESVDVVVTRSVLIYMPDKPAAFAEFFRVLRPGGRISLYEPINRFVGDGFLGYDVSPLGPIAQKLNAVYETADRRSAEARMTDFDERDLLAYAEATGFFPIRLRLDAEIRRTDAEPLDAFLNRAANPLVPSLVEAMHEVLSERERECAIAYLRPLVEEGAGTWRMATAYLSAEKPPKAPTS